MRRFLVVGCGGSGGATLAYMMDQLRSELGAYGFGLPAGWQFVHIDVPVAADRPPDGLGTVPQQGGTYVGCGTQGAAYAPLDSTVCANPRVLDELATWIPRDPQSETTPINVGAGQYRSIGRMITLSRAVELHQRLGQVWANLLKIETVQELAAIEQAMSGSPRSDASVPPPVVLVVSSMAGGSGASMALDVCRLLTLIPVTGSIGLFMFSADVFDSLAPNARTGVRGNSLAMAGEIIAAQSGASRPHDQALLSALGLNAGYGVTPPFARVFPVSRQVGLDHTPFGDGEQSTVYRGLARGLAGLMTSEQAVQDFVAYDLGNTGQLDADKKAFGWGLNGAAWAPMPWGAFGYACLSTGRERFGEYAAQRIASGAVDRLVRGHESDASSASSVEQLRSLLDSQWDSTCLEIGLPRNRQEFMPWLTSRVFGESVADTQAIVANEIEPFLSAPPGQTGPQFLQGVRMQLQGQRARLNASAEQAAYRRVFTWHQNLAAATLAAVTTGAARHGLPYGAALLDRVESHLRDLIMSGAQEGGRRAPNDVAAIPAESEASVGAIRGVIANGHQVMSGLLDGLRHPIRWLILAQGCRLVEQVVPAFIAEYLTPLRTTLGDAQAYLELMRDPVRTPLSDIGLARLQTDHYRAWPSDHNHQVPDRFTHALNEVLLIRSSEFDGEYRKRLTMSVQTEPARYDAGPALGMQAAYETAREAVIGQVIAGEWPTARGMLPPRDLIEQTAMWRTRVFGYDPTTGQATVPQTARFQLRCRPADVLGRARLYVERPGQSFDDYVKTSLRDLLNPPGNTVTDAERVQQQAEVLTAFGEALGRARPMMSVNREAVNKVHSQETARYRYKFSEVPFRDLPIANDLSATLRTNPDIDAESVQIFDRALRGEESKASRIDIFGSYANLSPIVFDAVLTPASDEWAATRPGGKEEYWRLRRSRPLAASLPMADIERRAMVAGWLIGQIVGEVRMPAPPFSDRTGPAEVWNPTDNRWVPFPSPLLTPPLAFIAEYDWLPAVLESSLLALAGAARQPIFASMQPYQLLRAIYDESDTAPTTVGALTQLAGERRLIAWLASGRGAGGEPSRVPGAAQAATIDDRAAATLEWLEAINNLAGREYVAPGDSGAPGGGKFSSISSRRQASMTPLFRDIAPDVFTVTTELRNLVNQAAARAQSGGGPAGRGGPGDDPGLAPPSAGVSF